jgi:signal transduction histidine kinase
MSSLGQVAARSRTSSTTCDGHPAFVEVIARQAPSTRHLSDALDHIRRSISRGKRASQEILRFANPKEPQLFAIDVHDWLPTLVGQLVPALPSSITLSSSLEPGIRFIRGDGAHLEQVITNLVFNAREAITGKGTIHIGVSRTGDDADAFVRISVSDDGPGIPPSFSIASSSRSSRRSATARTRSRDRARLMEGTRRSADGGESRGRRFGISHPRAGRGSAGGCRRSPSRTVRPA